MFFVQTRVTKKGKSIDWVLDPFTFRVRVSWLMTLYLGEVEKWLFDQAQTRIFKVKEFGTQSSQVKNVTKPGKSQRTR